MVDFENRHLDGMAVVRRGLCFGKMTVHRSFIYLSEPVVEFVNNAGRETGEIGGVHHPGSEPDNPNPLPTPGGCRYNR